MTNATNKVLAAATQLVKVLSELEADDRIRVVQAAFLMLGDSAPAGGTPNPLFGPHTLSNSGQVTGQGTGTRTVAAGGEKLYFDTKQPTNKLEELAVAARFREESSGAASSTKEDFKAVMSAARRNFDAGNYGRDIANARTRGYFNKGSGSDAVLSHFGQSFVDALPNREAAGAIRRPKGSGSKRAAAKKSPTAKKK